MESERTAPESVLESKTELFRAQLLGVLCAHRATVIEQRTHIGHFALFERYKVRRSVAGIDEALVQLKGATGDDLRSFAEALFPTQSNRAGIEVARRALGGSEAVRISRQVNELGLGEPVLSSELQFDETDSLLALDQPNPSPHPTSPQYDGQ